MLGCKLNRQAVEYLAEKGSSAEISLLLYLSRICSSHGNVEDINYHIISKKLGFSYQSFYNALYKLEKNNVITINHISTYLNCSIVNNLYISEKDFKKGYVNTNLDFLMTTEFLKAKLNIKKLVLRYLLAAKGSKGNYYVAFKTLVAHLGGLVRKTLLWEYLDVMKRWFSIKESKKDALDNLIFTITLESVASEEYTKDLYWTHKLESFCRRNEVKTTKWAMKDTIRLIKIYGYKEEVNKEFEALMSIIYRTAKRKKKLLPRLINSTLSFELKHLSLNKPPSWKIEEERELKEIYERRGFYE